MRAINDVKKQLQLILLRPVCVRLKGIKLLQRLYSAYFQLAPGLVFGLVSASGPSEEYTSAVMKYPGTQRLPVAAN